uniref:Uncharacterized protein n=1 Tax=viral metagenome TaxID=1070528 RepID=A0A6C0IW29_9ZZZZ
MAKKTLKSMIFGNKKSTRKNNTVKKGSTFITQKQQQKIVITFLQMLNTVKLYHWKTHSHSQHVASDTLYTDLNASIDEFVEIMMGKEGSRVNLTGQKSIPLLDYTNINDFKKEVERYKNFLINMDFINVTNNSDLLNTRDEILGLLNKFTYLLTLE